MSRPKLAYKYEQRPRTGLHASDYGVLEANILLHLKGVEPTNPPQWNDTLKWSAGKGVELGMVNVLKENGIVSMDFDQDANDALVTERQGVLVTSHPDALVRKGEPITLKMGDSIMPQDEEIVLSEGEPIEIKSINNKNFFDIQKYIDNKPKENYVGQLAGYMDALGKTRGHLFVSSIDGLESFWFVCEKREDGLYYCGDTVVDLTKEHSRWAAIWAKHKKGEEPNWFEETYKLPIEEINFGTLSNSKIGDVRNGRYVVGSENKWKIDYSVYKDIILEKQGVKPGYSEEELEIIRSKTAGYSSKKKNEIPTDSVKSVS